MIMIVQQETQNTVPRQFHGIFEEFLLIMYEIYEDFPKQITLLLFENPK